MALTGWLGRLRPGARPPLSLALQGGGAHGAYTWGVLDALLARGHSRFPAISGTSAGAMNALVVASGLLSGGADGARESLDAFWTETGQQAPFEWMTQQSGGQTTFTPAARWLMHLAQWLSPYQTPGQRNPLRDLVDKHVDFERLRSQDDIHLHIAATNANSGRLRLFGNAELSTDVALASACLPMLNRAIEIDGEPYWDGGYSANPAVFPLLHDRHARDVLIVMLSPWSLGDTPHSVEEIRARTLDIAFNATFLREMHAIADLTRDAQPALWPGGLDARLRRLRWHLIDGHDALAHLHREPRLIAHGPFLAQLRDAGRDAANDWLDRRGQGIGRASTLDLDALFGGSVAPIAPSNEGPGRSSTAEPASSGRTLGTQPARP